MKSPRFSLFTTLVIYYGILQTVHLAMNFVIIFFHPELIQKASVLLNFIGAKFMMFSSYIDFFLASPLGIIGVLLYLSSHKKPSKLLILLSLIFAWLSAILYITILVAGHAFIINSTNISFGILFLPVIRLTIKMCEKK